MIDYINNKLYIFNEFIIDYKLKKNSRNRLLKSTIKSLTTNNNDYDKYDINKFINYSSYNIFELLIQKYNDKLSYNYSLFNSLILILINDIYSLFIPYYNYRNKYRYFKFIKNLIDILNNNILINDNDKLENIYNTLIKLKDNNQYRAYDILNNIYNIKSYELKLENLEIFNYITDVELMNISYNINGIALVWINDYIGIIDDDTINVKNKLDDYDIFDNYVILYDYYNIDNNVFMFGLIKESNKLYYIRTWNSNNLIFENM